MCVFTTHTPVPAAHDQFSPHLAERILSRSPMSQLMHRCCYGGALNMTYLALNFSHYVNGVPCAAAKSRARCLEGTTSTRSRLYEYCRDQRPSSRLRVEGKTYFQLERLGMPSRWNTLRALRVLKWWNRAETTGE